MSFVSNQDAKERIRQAVDIVDLIGRDLPLRRQGRLMVALCPWHDDTKPSLQVNPDRQTWKCWVCNLGGDIFNFVMEREKVSFPEALKMLAERAGIELQAERRATRALAGSPDDKNTLYSACGWAQQQFRECLQKSPEAEAARQYFAKRELSADSAAVFHLGYSPDNWQWLVDRARSTSFSPAVLEAAGLIGKSQNTGRYYDRFKGRVIFPIGDPQGRTIAFGGRILPGAKDDAAKYVNSPETRLFSKSEHVYGLDAARDAIGKARNVVVVEGYTDVIMAHQFGLKNFVAVLGTALGARHIQLLRRYAETITLLLDGDEAGQKRTNEVLELFVGSEMDLRILTLPGGLDPCDFLREHGAEALQGLLGQTIDALEHAVTAQTRGLDLLRDTQRASAALEQLLSIISKAPRLTTETSSARVIRERQIVARLAREFRVEESMLRTRITELRKGSVVAPARRSEEPPPAVRPKDLDPWDAELIEILTQHPELADTALAEVNAEELASRPTRIIYEKYRIMSEQGEPVEFARILSELDDPQLKSLFVSLDEQATAKEELAQEDASARLRRLIDHLHERREEAGRRQSLAALDKRQLDAQAEIELLQQLVEQERRRQGIPAPTDG